MIEFLSTPINAATSALVGACVGGLVALIGVLLNLLANAARDRKSFERQKRLRNLEQISDSYQFALNVIFNVQRGGSPDRSTRGNVFGQISLFGSDRVRSLCENFLAMSADEQKEFDLDALSAAMRSHLMTLEERP